jgi:hypothetical protein
MKHELEKGKLRVKKYSRKENAECQDSTVLRG